MTHTVSSSPVRLDLATINEVQSVVVSELRNQVITWEEHALEAARQGDYRSAQQYRDWSFAADLLAHRVGSACTSLFLDTCGALPIIEDTRVVQLPQIQRSTSDLRLDDLTLEVISQMPQPAV